MRATGNVIDRSSALLLLALLSGCAPARPDPELCALLRDVRALVNEQWDENALLIRTFNSPTDSTEHYFEGGYPYRHTTGDGRLLQLRIDAYALECGCEWATGPRWIVTETTDSTETWRLVRP